MAVTFKTKAHRGRARQAYRRRGYSPHLSYAQLLLYYMQLILELYNGDSGLSCVNPDFFTQDELNALHGMAVMAAARIPKTEQQEVRGFFDSTRHEID